MDFFVTLKKRSLSYHHPKPRTMKKNIDKLDSIKMKNSCIEKKSQSQDTWQMEKMVTEH